MRKYLVSFLVMGCFMACLLVTGCKDENAANGPARLAVVDMQRLVRDSEPGKQAEKFWEGLVNEMRADISGLEGKLEKNPKDEALEKEFQTAYMQAQQRLQAEQQNMANILNDLIQRSLNSLREKNGYDVILDAEMVRAFAPAVDVTAAAIAEVNSQKVEFKPLPVPKPGQPEPDADAAASKPEAADAKADMTDKKGDDKEKSEKTAAPKAEEEKSDAGKPADGGEKK